MIIVRYVCGKKCAAWNVRMLQKYPEIEGRAIADTLVPSVEWVVTVDCSPFRTLCWQSTTDV